jgi:hypothetical protein
MRSQPRVRRRRWVIAALAAGAALGAVALLTACGGSSSSAGTAASADQQQGIEYAQCMRDNGVPDFPDPNADGRFSLTHGGDGVDQDDPTFRAAAETCRELAPGGEHQNVGDPTYVEQMRSFSRCMRENGLPDFPDPDANGQLQLPHGEGGYGDPKVEAAMEKCREKLPGGGEH